MKTAPYYEFEKLTDTNIYLVKKDISKDTPEAEKCDCAEVRFIVSFFYFFIIFFLLLWLLFLCFAGGGGG